MKKKNNATVNKIQNVYEKEKNERSESECRSKTYFLCK